MNKLKFAIIGCGRIAARHAEIINNIAELSAVCDIKPERANDFAEKYSADPYNAIEELLKNENNIDVVSICTPNSFHTEHTILALKAGKNVLCEKPMAISVSDCKRMMIEADKSGKDLFIVKQNRFNPPVAALKEVIDSGKLGKLLNVELNCFWNRNDEYYRQSDWKGKKAIDGGTLFTQFSHFIDLLYWLIGDFKSLNGIGRNFIHNELVEFEDTGVVMGEFENGALCTINYTVNSHKQNMEGSITVFGEKGTVKIGGQYLNVLEYQSIDGFEITGLPASRPANDYGFYQGSMSNHEKVYENVLDVLTKGGTIAANAYEGMKTVEIIERIYKSMEGNE
ncbi:MAG TPA: Gfo/Idh/MocA family oxidoreductase [Ignavibacteria bacterium]|nr:Gfo/Idh/MocA family oxidoreductase [Ignavibacteria bacterium]HRF64887.1 Gfo/Idh/MocA family oxidoreductase [Ignavibacteria bacterium]HRJ04649.1 Gfo/Idh/MocA family oxidoreductase [Ignavibacteria bacterium]